MTLQTKSFSFPLQCSVTWVVSTSRSLASNTEKSEDFDACRFQTHVSKTCLIFETEICQEQDAFVRLAGALFALWAGNTKLVIPLSALDSNRKFRYFLGERMEQRGKHAFNLSSPLPFPTPGIVKTKTKFSTYKILCPIFPYYNLSTKDLKKTKNLQIPKTEEVGEN